MPAERPAVFIWHVTVKNPGIIIKNQGQKKTVALPHGQAAKSGNRLPGQWPFLVFMKRNAAEPVNPEDKTEPAAVIRAEIRPVDGAAQGHPLTFKPGLFPYFPAHTADYIFIGPHLAAQAVIFAEMNIIRPPVTMDKQSVAAVRRNNKTQGGDYGRIG